MNLEEIKLELPQHLSASAIQSVFRPPFRNPEHDDFCKRAYKILGERKYTRIYNKWERQFRSK